MKEVIATIPFLINKSNQELLLDGKRIVNIDDIPSMIIKMMNTSDKLYIYEVRSPDDKRSQYPEADNIIGEVIGVDIKDKDNPKLKILINNTLVYCQYDDPVVRVNGFMDENDNNIIITEITRLSIGSSKFKNIYLL